MERLGRGQNTHTCDEHQHCTVSQEDEWNDNETLGGGVHRCEEYVEVMC